MSEQFRTPALAYDAAVGIDRDSETIKGVAIMQVGEISRLDGRKQFVDAKTLEQYVQLASVAVQGLRARMTHGQDGEGIGLYLGRWLNPRVDGDRVRQDLKLSPRSHDSLKGDIGRYILDMSESDPDMLGASMIATLDYAAMRKEMRADGFMPIRLRTLHGADIVDTPALVSSGMFAAGHNAGEKDMSESAAPAGITQEQFDVGLKELGKSLTETILAQVAEKFAAKPSDPQDGATTPEELEKRGAVRASQIMAYAATSGLNDHAKLAQEAIDGGMSVETFKASLADRLIAQNKLSKDGGEDHNSGDPLSKFRAEFKAGREQFATVGVVDEDAYVRSRCRDEGLPVPEIKKAS